MVAPRQEKPAPSPMLTVAQPIWPAFGSEEAIVSPAPTNPIRAIDQFDSRAIGRDRKTMAEP
jgi:hypothetical protein